MRKTGRTLRISLIYWGA